MNDCRLECVGTFDVRASEHAGPAPRAELGALARTTPPDMSVEVNDATAEVTERIHIEVEQQVLACMARMDAHLRRRRKEQAPVLAALPAPVAQAVIVRHHENRRSDSSTGSMRIGQRSSTFSAWRSTDARTWTHSKNWFQSSHS